MVAGAGGAVVGGADVGALVGPVPEPGRSRPPEARSAPPPPDPVTTTTAPATRRISSAPALAARIRVRRRRRARCSARLPARPAGWPGLGGSGDPGAGASID